MTEALRKKYESIRNGRNEYERKMEETFKPITDPLKELVNLKPYKEISKESIIKDEIKEKDEEEDLKITKKFKVKKKLEDSFDIPNTSKKLNLDDSFATPLSSLLDPLDQKLRNNVWGEEEEADEEEQENEEEPEVERDKTVVEMKMKKREIKQL